jgi:two-component system phosphate regulon sensor histidine kinase PhoR
MLSFVLNIFLALVVFLLGFQCFYHSRRIKEIRRVIRAIAQGDFSSRMPLSLADRLGDVALYINELAQGIEKRLQEITNEKEKLEAILSNMAEGVLVISAQERLVHLSPRFLDMFEVRSYDWPKKYYWEIISNQTINESIREAMTHRKVLSKNISISHPQEMFFNMLISPVLDSRGNLISLVAVFHDVTELKKYERLRTEFVANVSHELKTPLTSIKGFVETLQGGAIEDKTNATRFLDIIAKQTHRLEDLVNDLLILSSLESKDVKMSFVKTEITSILSSVVLMKKKQIEELGHELVLEVAPNLSVIMMDPQRMEQVFLNLLDNAVKFTPPGGKVQIKVTLEGKYLRTDVIDNGPGISSEYLNRIFERFFRVDKSRSQETGGTGLGLSIVKHIVEAHYGKVSVESTLGRGARFSVFLPVDMI